jgi:D-alanyl-D-alanine carboxypeptidase
MKTTSFSTILLLLLLTVAVPGQPFDKAKLDQFFDRLAEKNKAMGSLVIAKEANTVYERSIGFAQITVTEKKLLTAASRFRIGSITKLFTAAIVFQLVEEKKLKLTETLDKFFPQIPNASKITIGQILMHRSGIHDSVIDPSIRTSPKTAVITKDEILALIARGKPDFEPDARQQYSNSGYLVLGMIIEKVTGKPYAEVLSKRIIAKTGLMDTYLATGPIDVAKNEALTYRYIGGWKQEAETHPSLLFSSGAMVSTPADLAKFVAALFDGKLISKEHFAMMKPAREGEWLLMESFGFAGKTFYGHTGGADNYGSWLAYQPEGKLAVAYTTNAKVHPVKDIVSGAIEIYYGRPFQIPTFESIAIDEAVLDKYVGVYASPDAPNKFTISRRGSTLFVQPGQQNPAPLEATAQDKFKLEGAPVAFEFDPGKGQMTMKRAGREIVFTKEK